MFSSRTTWDRTENQLTSLLRVKRRSGAAVLDLTDSNPTRAGIPRPADLLASLAGPESLVYDPEPRGLSRPERPSRRTTAAVVST